MEGREGGWEEGWRGRRKEEKEGDREKRKGGREDKGEGRDRKGLIWPCNLLNYADFKVVNFT